MSHEEPKQLIFRSVSVAFVGFSNLGYWDDFLKLISTSDKRKERIDLTELFSFSNVLYIPTAPLLAGFRFLLLLIQLPLILHLFCVGCFVSVAFLQHAVLESPDCTNATLQVKPSV